MTILPAALSEADIAAYLGAHHDAPLTAEEAEAQLHEAEAALESEFEEKA